MDIFAKNTFLLRLVYVLILLNLCSIGGLWWQNSKHKAQPRPKRDFNEVAAILKTQLQLTDEQEQKFKKIRLSFFEKESVLKELIKKQRDSMNVLMFNEQTDTIFVKNIARRLANNEYQMELYRIGQAQELKMICTKEQLQKFEHLVIDIRDFFQPEKKK